MSLARFNIERISLPETLKGLPELADMLPEEARRLLNSQEHVLRQDPLEEELIKPYYDPSLRNKRNYKDLIQQLHEIGYLRFTRCPKAMAGFLCNFCDDIHRLHRPCSGHGGWCSRTQRPHLLLSGTGQTGEPRGVAAASYPAKLCKALAHVLTSPYHTRHSM